MKPRRLKPGLAATAGCVLLWTASLADAGLGAGTRLAFVEVPGSAQEALGGAIHNTILADAYVTGMQVILADPADVAGTRQLVSEGFTCAADPAFSADGTRLAFAARGAEDPFFQIWEWVEGEPGGLQRLFEIEADCIQPEFLPDGGIVFASSLAGENEEHGGLRSFSLYRWEPGDAAPTRLTFNPSSDFDPFVLPDGRIAYSSWQHVGNHFWPRGNVALMLINSDGTGIFPLTGNHREGWLRRGAAVVGTTQIAFVEAPRFEQFGAGRLLTTDLNDAFAAYEAFPGAEDLTVNAVRWFTTGVRVLSARDDSRSFGLWMQSSSEVEVLYDPPGTHELDPVVGPIPYAQDTRFSVVVPDKSYGYLMVLDCYETDRSDQHPLEEGSIRAVRVIEGLPPQLASQTAATARDWEVREPHAPYIPSRILGEVEPDPDGSVYLKVPADRPLRLQLIDTDGFARRNERAWFWVRPHERRVCIGCHEDRELTPRNQSPLAAGREPADLTDPSGWRTVSFEEDIEPILESGCGIAGCHSPPDPTAGLNLTPMDPLAAAREQTSANLHPAFVGLMKPQIGKPRSVGGRLIHPGDALSSPLIWWLEGRRLAPDYEPAPFDRPMMKPHPDENPVADSLVARFKTWIDLGAPHSVAGPVISRTRLGDAAAVETKP